MVFVINTEARVCLRVGHTPILHLFVSFLLESECEERAENSKYQDNEKYHNNYHPNIDRVISCCNA